MKKEINVEIGLRIRQKREAMGLTREQLAEQANLSAQFLGEIELGKKGISPLTIRKLCDTLYISADYLIRNQAPTTHFPEITALLSRLDSEYLPLAEELLKTYVRAFEGRKWS